MSELDQRVPLAAFRWLEEQQRLQADDTFRYDLLLAGFSFESTRVPLLGPQGIFKPAILAVPLSITTVPPSDQARQPAANRCGGMMRID